MTRRQQSVAAIVYFFFGVIIFFLFVSFALKFFVASGAFFNFFYGISDFFAGMFRGIYPDLIIGPFVISTYTFIAMVFYSMFAYLAALFIVSFVELNPFRIIRNLIRFFFRVIESILFTRFLFMALAASTSSSFVTFIYGLTDPAITQLDNIIPTLYLGIFAIEFSTFFLLGIVIFLDILFENLFAGFFGDDSR